MRCTSVQSRLLALPDPAVVPGALQAHLNTCPACQAWHRGLVAVEAALPLLPVPASDGRAKAALLEKLRETRVVPTLAVSRAVEERESFRDRALRWGPAIAVAATVLLGTFAFLSLGGKPTPEVAQLPPDPLLDRMVKHNVALASADTPTQRVETLVQLAGELHPEMLDLAMIETGDGLKNLHILFSDVVGGVKEQAAEVNGPQRTAVLTRVAEQLDEVGQKAEAAFAQARPQARRPFRDSAATARDGSRKIRDIIQGRT